MSFFLRWLVTAVAVAAAIYLIPGIVMVGSDQLVALALGSLCVAFVNAIIRPITRALSLPLTILTLGIFYIILNGLMLELASWLSLNVFGTGIQVNGLGSAILGSIVISIVTCIMDALVDKK
ncbi:MAG: phage holin family protein [Coriobacteriia bacterium]|nr:phage holin family protein [Coriobacteriia bacterium]